MYLKYEMGCKWLLSKCYIVLEYDIILFLKSFFMVKFVSLEPISDTIYYYVY